MNKANLHLVAMLLLILGCSSSKKTSVPTPKPEGQNVGNGGDPSPKLFERARAHAVRMLEQILEIKGPRKDWFQNNRSKLRDDVRNTPAYLWVKSNPNGACGQTEDKPLSIISLSYDHCGRIQTVRDAAIHLIGESIHHFGIRDDAFTANIAVAVSSAWDQLIGSSNDAIERRMLFEQGRIHASEVFLRIDEARLPTSFKNLYTDEQRAWLVDKRKEVAREIADTEHVWVDGELSPGSDPDEKCLATAAKLTAEIELSYSGCAGAAARREGAGQLLAEAALYHLRPNRAEAKKLAALAYATWFNMGHPDQSHWLTLPTFSLGDSDVNAAIWTGSEILVWSSHLRNIYLYQPRTNTWKSSVAEGGEKLNYRSGEGPGWVDGYLVIFGDCYGTGGKLGAGSFFDLKKLRWQPISREEAPEERWFGSATTLSVAKKYIVFGGRNECNFSPEAKQANYPNDFGVFDPKANRWSLKKVGDVRSPLVRDGQVVATTEKEIVVWGGRSFSSELGTEEMHNDGAIFDFSGKKIREMTVTNAPKARGWSKSVVATHYFVMFGGYEVGDHLSRPYSRSIISDGAIYDLDADSWVPMNMNGAPKLSPDKPFSLLWIGNEVLYVGHVVAYFNPFKNEWRTPERMLAPLLTNTYRLDPIVFWTGLEAILWDSWTTGAKLSGYAFYP